MSDTVLKSKNYKNKNLLISDRKNGVQTLHKYAASVYGLPKFVCVRVFVGRGGGGEWTIFCSPLTHSISQKLITVIDIQTSTFARTQGEPSPMEHRN
jgi:hypothetical protein